MRDLTDPDDLPGLAEVTADDLPRYDIVARLLAGESVLVDPAVTPADLLAGRVTEITFPIQRPQEPTMQPETARRDTGGTMPDTAAEAYLAPEPERGRRAHVADGLNTLGVELDDLERLVNILEERITSILGPAEPSPGPSETDPTPSNGPGGPSEVAELIFARNRHAAAISYRLARIIDRIDV